MQRFDEPSPAKEFGNSWNKHGKEFRLNHLKDFGTMLI